MRKVLDYGVIPISQVESGLRRGYEPLGRAFIGLNEEGLLQTVVKYEEPRDTSAEEIRKIVDANFILMLRHVKKRRDELGACKDFSLEEARLLPLLKEFVELIVTYHNRVLDEIHRKTLTTREDPNQ